MDRPGSICGFLRVLRAGRGPLLAELAENEAVVEVLISAFFDHAVTRTLVAADGSVVDQVTIDMLLECRGPSSVAWLEGGGFAVTCTTSDRLATFPEQVDRAGRHRRHTVCPAWCRA
jgi:hypothetical protein